jgi:hypothetical protein
MSGSANSRRFEATRRMKFRRQPGQARAVEDRADRLPLLLGREDRALHQPLQIRAVGEHAVEGVELGGDLVQARVSHASSNSAEAYRPATPATGASAWVRVWAPVSATKNCSLCVSRVRRSSPKGGANPGRSLTGLRRRESGAPGRRG